MDLDARARLIPTEALRLVAEADRRSVPLKVTGSVAVGWHCPQAQQLMVQLGRRPYHDIDYWALSKDTQAIEALFEADGYVSDLAVKRMREWGVKRLIFEHPETAIKVDVFMDELVMAHTIPFADRLGAPGPCVSLPDLLLSKLQVHEITENDLIDIAALLLVHDPDRLGFDRVVDQICSEWGFWYDAGANLTKLGEALDRFGDVLDRDARASIDERRRELAGRLEAAPKDRRWKMRARIGTRKRWYELVGDVER